MLFYSFRRKLLKSVISKYHFYRILQKTSKIQPKEKILFVDVRKIALNRYLYCFLKFFHLSGYTVYLPRDLNVIAQLSRDQGESRFASLLLKEDFIKFGIPPQKSKNLYISSDQISNNYFSAFYKDSYSSDTFHVPMCEFPLVYSRFWPNIKVSIEVKRKRSIFMVGNIGPQIYYNIGKANFFQILSRKEVAEYLYSKKYFLGLTDIDDLNNFITGKEDNRVIIIDTSKDFSIGLEKLKQIIKEFDFYLALPGILIPQSHNLAEAMAVGSIPVIHTTYAHTFTPALINHYNALLYDTLDELDQVINSVFNLREQEIINIRKNVLDYYDRYLKPEAVVEKIEKKNFRKIYLQAEAVSLTEFRNERNGIE